jgi:hypothetical protein
VAGGIDKIAEKGSRAFRAEHSQISAPLCPQLGSHSHSLTAEELAASAGNGAGCTAG